MMRNPMQKNKEVLGWSGEVGLQFYRVCAGKASPMAHSWAEI